MMKSPDEIKKALECCFYESAQCRECPYYPTTCDRELVRDAREYIRQLEAQNAELLKKVEQFQAERDAAVADIRLAFTSYVGACQTCKHVKGQVDCDNPLGCGHCGEEKCKCNSCDNDYSNWEWRGVQKEE